MSSLEKKGLNAKDLINIGIYTALYLVVFFVVGLLTAIPVIYPFLFVVWPIMTGIPFMLYTTKIKKPGMLIISAMILASAWFLMGYPWYVFVTYFIFGLAAEFAFKAANYKDFKMILIGYWLFSCGCIGVQLPIWLVDGYLDGVEEMMGSQYAEQLATFMPDWLMYGAFVLIFVGAFIGAMLGKKMLRKHFERAGIA